MTPAFDRCEPLLELGVEHGFGTRGSAEQAPSSLAQARQVHGDRVAVAREPRSVGEADALFTDVAGLAVGIWTADCVPILIAEPSGRRVAAVHAGWRGSAQEIAAKAVAVLSAQWQVAPAALLAAIGPHIGPCCYEVDEPVRSAIADPDVFARGRRSGRYQLDLHALNRRQLLAAGLDAGRIGHIAACTACDATRYFSFRRDGSSGRMLHYIRAASARA